MTASTKLPDGAWRIDYADGAGNRYTLVASEDAVDVTYDPVTPATSSSGLYSGGPPRRARVPRDDPRWTELWSRLADAQPAASPARLKGTGAFTLTTGEGARELVLPRGPALAAIDALLATVGA